MHSNPTFHDLYDAIIYDCYECIEKQLKNEDKKY